MIDSLIDFIGDLLYGRSGSKNLAVDATIEGELVTLTLLNQGKGKLKFAAVQALGRDGKRHFPQSDLAPQTTLSPGVPVKVSFNLAELPGSNCHIEVLDTTGRAWPTSVGDWAS